jgi:hypothetical protein
MVLPLVGIAAGVAARTVAKKAATSAVKKVATKKAANAAAKSTAKKRVPATYTPTKKAVPTKVVKKTTPPIVKQPSLENLLKENYAKALKITKARGGDPKSVSVTIDGKTIDYKGIR